MNKHQAIGYGTCQACGERFSRGTWIIRLSLGKFEHVECPKIRVTELTFDERQDCMVASAEVDGMVTRFVWNRSEGDGVGQIHIETGNHQQFYDWNVWDYERKSPSMPYNLPTFRSYIRERLTHGEDLDLLMDMRIGTLSEFA